MCKRINAFFPCLLGGYFVLSMIISIILGMLNLDLPYWASIVLSQLALLLPAVIYCIVMKINVVKCIPYRKIKPLDALYSILVGYMLIPIVIFINSITMLFATNHVEESSSELTAYPFIAQIILLAVIPPIVEEFVFRGLFYHSYRKNGILGAAVASGIVFGIVHMNINQFCYTVIMGIVLAIMVEATGSMFSSMLAHFAFNTYSITMMKLLEILDTSAEATEGTIEAVTQTTAVPDAAMIVSQIMAMLVWGAIGVAFLMLAYQLIMHMAKRNGREQYLRFNLKKGLKPQNGEKFYNLSYIITAVVAGIYMVLIEIATRV